MKQKLSINQRLSIADRWDIAAKVWHTDKEIEIIKTLMEHLQISQQSVISDVACGTGFHSINLSNLGHNVIASDIDENNLKIFSKRLYEDDIKNITVFKMDWLKMQSTLFTKVDALMCLGSSITYFESWKEGKHIDSKNRIVGLKNVLHNFKNAVKVNGKVIIGFSRHYPENKNLEIVNFEPIVIEGELLEMKWFLELDWKNFQKKWTCDVRSEHNNYTFDLESHLYTLDEFKSICLTVFDNVEVLDINANYYDLFVVCS